MPHRKAMRRDERPARGAHHRGRGKGTDAKDSTEPGSERAVMSTPEGRKSTRDERRAVLLEGMGVPAPWRRLGDIVSATPWETPIADATLRTAREAA